MPTIEEFTHRNEKAVYVVKGPDYRCHISVEDFRKHDEGVRVSAFRVDQSEHPDITFENMDKEGVDCIYRGDSISEGWNAIQKTMGPVDIPDRLESFLR